MNKQYKICNTNFRINVGDDAQRLNKVGGA